MDKGNCRLGEGECSIAGKITNGWCVKHYQRIRKNGGPDVLKRIMGDDVARFWSYVDRKGDDECWLWTGHVDDSGYGIIGIGSKLLKAHKWAYETFIGPIPADRPVLDHACHTRDMSCTSGLCDHRRCVNYLRGPNAHLDPVTQAENMRRKHQWIVSDDEARELHRRWFTGEIVKDLASEAGVGTSAIYNRFSRMGLPSKSSRRRSAA